jgi:hypothetical protein
MNKAMEEQILRASKEIAVKFIETGRLSPTGFADTFKSIYQAVRQTVVDAQLSDWPDDTPSRSD